MFGISSLKVVMCMCVVMPRVWLEMFTEFFILSSRSRYRFDNFAWSIALVYEFCCWMPLTWFTCWHGKSQITFGCSGYLPVKESFSDLNLNLDFRYDKYLKAIYSKSSTWSLYSWVLPNFRTSTTALFHLLNLSSCAKKTLDFGG